MDKILTQLGGLILGSVPTILFFLLLVIAYALLVRRPLDSVLAERRVRTTGAVEQAKEAISAAEAETAVFEDKLRTAKRAIFEDRDRKRKQWAAERDRALDQARTATQDKVKTARESLEQSVVVARQQIETMSGELSAQILKAVLPPDVAGTEATQ